MAKKRIIIIFCIFILLFISILNVSAQIKIKKIPRFIQQDNFRIEASKDTYYCEPIKKGNKCLIKIDYFLENKNLQNKIVDVDFKFEQKNKIRLKDIKDKSLRRSIDVANPEKTRSVKFNLRKNSKKYFTQEYWVDMGDYQKFNISIWIKGYGTLVLDPIINATFNATVPSEHLVDGSNMNFNNSQYAFVFDITNQISDGNASTAYYTTPVGFDVPISRVIEGYSFNDLLVLSPSILHGFFRKADGTIFGGVTSVQGYGENNSYYAGRFDGSTGYISIPNNPIFDIPAVENFTACFTLNSSVMPVVNDYTVYSNRNTGGGIETKIKKTTGIVECRFDDNVASVKAKGVTNIVDGLTHAICCRKTLNTVDLWIDGVQDATLTGTIGNIVSLDPLEIGAKAGAKFFNGDIATLGFVNMSIPNSVLTNMNNKRIVNYTKGDAISVFYNHTLDLIGEYLLQLETSTIDISVIRVNSYINLDEVNTTNFIDTVITSGTSFIPLTSNNFVPAGYNLPFRIYSISGNIDSLIQDVYLFETTNDTKPPNVVNPQYSVTPPTVLTCSQGFNFTVNITDDQAVLNAFVMNNYINNTNIKSNQLLKGVGDTYFIVYDSTEIQTDLQDFGYLFDGTNVNISLHHVNATDIVGNINQTNYTFGQIAFEYSCNSTEYINITHNSTLGVDVLNLTNESVTIQWTTNNPTDSKVNYGITPLNFTFVKFSAIDVTIHVLNLTNLNSNTTYYYNVTSQFNPAQTLSGFNFTTLSNAGIPPSDILNFTNISQTINTVFLNWTNPSDLDYNYSELYFNQSGGNLTFIVNVSSPSNEYNVTGLTNATLYTFQIRPVDNSTNKGNFSTITTTTLQTTQIEPNTGGGGGGFDFFKKNDSLRMELNLTKFGYFLGEDIPIKLKTFFNNKSKNYNSVTLEVRSLEGTIGNFILRNSGQGEYSLLYPNTLGIGNYDLILRGKENSETVIVSRRIRVDENPKLINLIYDSEGKVNQEILLKTIIIIMIIFFITFIAYNRRKKK